jgi:electron transport complex protein RnfA
VSDLLPILIGIVVVNDLAYARLPGRCPFLQAGAEPRAGVAATAAIVLTLLLTAAIFRFVDAALLVPLDHAELRLLACVVIVVAAVPAAELAVQSFAASHAQGAAQWPPHIMVNGAMLSAVLVATDKFAALLPAMAWAVATGAGFGLLMAAYADARRRLHTGEVPLPLRGAAIVLVTGGMLTLAASGLSGLLRS